MYVLLSMEVVHPFWRQIVYVTSLNSFDIWAAMVKGWPGAYCTLLGAHITINNILYGCHNLGFLMCTDVNWGMWLHTVGSVCNIYIFVILTKKDCTESWIGEKNILLHLGVVCISRALDPTLDQLRYLIAHQPQLTLVSRFGLALRR